MQTALTLALLSLCGALGDVCLAKGMKQVGALSTLRLRALLVLGRTMARNGAIRLGLLFMIANFVLFVVVLSWAEVSFIVPATSLHFVLATLGAKWLLHEPISRVRWCGTLLVGLGVALLALP
ncbi:MAG TPA: EamA family transporter [Candidatus Saccharimonadia bacterium]|jgi:drug/metabolite transporter (DMT)-like permease|nr:EamA family transporter [Candidatus Saccharimonadia bacterium]